MQGSSVHSSSIAGAVTSQSAISYHPGVESFFGLMAAELWLVSSCQHQ